jgi:hypothetical protein
MTKPFTTFIVGLLLVSLAGCSLGRFPISEVPVTPPLSLKDSEACDAAAFEAEAERPYLMSPWLLILEVFFWPFSELVFLPLSVSISNNPSASERAQLDTWKKPYTQCLIAKGYKVQ